ncbi:MAG: SDR family NAD(P)-dependent oxidoreductase, partial [Natronospirillum sp.]
NSVMPVPLLGAYSASKAAVKAYSDVLRMELMHEKVPVRVSVIMPSGVSTPISDHGRSHMGQRGKVMPPLYDSELVADAILTAAKRPVRDVTVGGIGRLTTLAWHLMPSTMDRFISWALPRAQASGQPTMPTDNLFNAEEDGYVYLNGQREGMRFSPYTKGRLHMNATLGLGLLIGTAVYLLNSEKRRKAVSKQALALRGNVGHYVGSRSLRHPLTNQKTLRYRIKHPVQTVQRVLQ